VLPSHAVERIGVGAAEVEFARWGWVFREQTVSDFGIDAHVEPYGDEGASGRLLALQIKSGPSWFEEPVTAGWVYRGKDRHLRYFYVAPAQWVRDEVRRRYDQWLESKGGIRPRNPASDHATLELDQISRWHRRWDVLAGSEVTELEDLTASDLAVTKQL
jgi:Domain of unknown function (DUF4365)